ncbi:MAG: hypothetical protein R2713_02775 [Ilumatobacteraceae bacterium]
MSDTMAHLDDGERHVSHARLAARPPRRLGRAPAAAAQPLGDRHRARRALALATVFGVLLGGTSSLDLTIGVADADRSVITSGFTGGLVAADTGGDPGTTDDDPVRFVAIDADGARSAVDDGDVDAAIVLPAGSR